MFGQIIEVREVDGLDSELVNGTGFIKAAGVDDRDGAQGIIGEIFDIVRLTFIGNGQASAVVVEGHRVRQSTDLNVSDEIELGPFAEAGDAVERDNTRIGFWI